MINKVSEWVRLAETRKFAAVFLHVIWQLCLIPLIDCDANNGWRNERIRVPVPIDVNTLEYISGNAFYVIARAISVINATIVIVNATRRNFD